MRACPGMVGNVDRVGMMGRLLSDWWWAGMEEGRAGWDIWAECLWVGMTLACRHGGQGAYRAGMVSMEREGGHGGQWRQGGHDALLAGGRGGQGGRDGWEMWARPQGGKCGQGTHDGQGVCGWAMCAGWAR